MYPVPESMFTLGELTPAEEKQYLELGNQNVQSLLAAMAEADPRCTWTFVKETSNGVRIHKGKIAGTAIDTIRGECSINVTIPDGAATVDDLVELLGSQGTTPQLRASYKFLDPMNQDILILRNISVPDNPKSLLSVQWAVFGSPGPVWNRDFAYLQFACKAKDPKSGLECAVVAAGSIERADIPPLSAPYNFVRGVLTGSGFAFRPTSDPAVWTCYYIVQLDPKGLIPPWLANLVAIDQASNSGRMRDYLQEIFQSCSVLGRTKLEIKGMDTLYVPAREGRDFVVTIPPEGAILDYCWWCSNGTIDFSLVPLEAKSHLRDVDSAGNLSTSPSSLLMPTRMEGGVKLAFRVCVSGGRWALRFDNSFSWMKAKHIYFLRVPTQALVPALPDDSLVDQPVTPPASSSSKKSIALLSFCCVVIALCIDASGILSTPGAVIAALFIGILAPFVFQGIPQSKKEKPPNNTSLMAAAPPGIFRANNTGKGVDPRDLFGLEQREWVADDASSMCKCCGSEFGMFLRKHHCRLCGNLVCDDCSKGRAVLAPWMQLSADMPKGQTPNTKSSMEATANDDEEAKEGGGGCFRKGVRVCNRCMTLMKDRSG